MMTPATTERQNVLQFPRAPEPPSATGAIERAVDAAQGMMSDSLDLARLELETAVSNVLQSFSLVVVGALLLVLAWTSLMLASYELLGSYTSSVASLLIIAVGNLVMGGLLIVVGAAEYQHGDG